MKKGAATPSFRPLYEQIKILLTQSLVAGEWKPGEAIPSELELAARFRVSQGTVRKAVDELASENIVVRRQGKGTFVASHSEPSYQYRFLRVTPDSGEKTHPHNLFFGLERGRAQGETARALALKPGTPTLGFKRVMSFAARPVIFDEIVFAASRFPGLTLAELEEFNGSVYSFYETVFGVRMIRAEERLRAVAADSVAAAHLKVQLATPLLCVDRIAFTYGDQPVEWRRGLCLTEGYSYFNELS
ncbi:MAG TPA: GntR family transcriptional regulator [Usitatibacter sp.]|jgi:GntR family transcriptional regulator|nr:GntR family transcriptional regulator [Usitatibacter sp.]